MIIMLTLSTLMGISSTSWIMVWVCLEVNTLSMCWLLAKKAKEASMNETTTMNYYLVQTIMSIVMLLSATTSDSILSSWAVSAAILAKMGAWPMHMWYMKLINSMMIKQTSMLVVMTWQKVLPAMLIMSMNLSKNIIMMVTMVSMVTLLAPLTKMVPHLTTKSILALSSLNSNSWIIITAMASMKCFGVFLSLYSASLLVTLNAVKSINKKSSMSAMSFWSSLILVANLGGIPPLTMFWSKMITLKAMMSSNMSKELMLMMVLSACFMLYHYMWMVNHENMKTPKKLQSPSKPEEMKSSMWWVTATSWVGMVLLTTSGLT